MVPFDFGHWPFLNCSVELRTGGATFSTMRKSDVICPECSAGYRRIELAARPGKLGEFRCLICDHVLELFDDSREVAPVPPVKYRDAGDNRFSNGHRYVIHRGPD
jgi:hypothetical protein